MPNLKTFITFSLIFLKKNGINSPFKLSLFFDRNFLKKIPLFIKKTNNLPVKLNSTKFWHERPSCTPIRSKPCLEYVK